MRLNFFEMGLHLKLQNALPFAEDAKSSVPEELPDWRSFLSLQGFIDMCIAFESAFTLEVFLRTSCFMRRHSSSG